MAEHLPRVTPLTLPFPIRVRRLPDVQDHDDEGERYWYYAVGMAAHSQGWEDEPPPQYGYLLADGDWVPAIGYCQADPDPSSRDEHWPVDSSFVYAIEGLMGGEWVDLIPHLRRFRARISAWK